MIMSVDTGTGFECIPGRTALESRFKAPLQRTACTSRRPSTRLHVGGTITTNLPELVSILGSDVFIRGGWSTALLDETADALPSPVAAGEVAGVTNGGARAGLFESAFGTPGPAAEQSAILPPPCHPGCTPLLAHLPSLSS